MSSSSTSGSPPWPSTSPLPLPAALGEPPPPGLLALLALPLCREASELRRLCRRVAAGKKGGGMGGEAAGCRLPRLEEEGPWPLSSGPRSLAPTMGRRGGEAADASIPSEDASWCTLSSRCPPSLEGREVKGTHFRTVSWAARYVVGNRD